LAFDEVALLISRVESAESIRRLDAGVDDGGDCLILPLIDEGE
jgi:hypothetical protein